MEEKNTDDWFRVHVEDHVRMVEERRRLREQVTALQATSTKQCLEIRELRETTEQWRREAFDQRDADAVWARVHKMLDDASAAVIMSPTTPKESSAAARIGALAAVNANLLAARREACIERGKFLEAQQVIDTAHAILDQAGVSRLTNVGSETRRTLVERIEAFGAHLRARVVKDLDARLNEALAVLDALVRSHTTAAQAASKQRAIELLNKEHGR